MKTIKPRKPRGIKLDGTRSQDLCPCCYSFGCDPMAMSRAFREKIYRRRENGECPSCGQPKEHCVCKSESALSYGNKHILRTHNNRKKRKASEQQNGK